MAGDDQEQNPASAHPSSSFYSTKRTTPFSGYSAEEEYPPPKIDENAPLIDSEEELNEPDQPIPTYFYLIVVVGFVCKGINESMPQLAYFYFCKDDLKEDPATVGSVTSLVKLIPWSIKPLYGLFTDAFPIFGTRRTSYIVIGMLACSTSWLLLGTVVNSLSFAAAMIGMGSIGGALANVCVEAVTVECSSGLTFTQAATLQSWQWGTGMVSSIAGSLIGGYMLDYTGNRGMFLLSACIPPIAIIAALFSGEAACEETDKGFVELGKEWASQMRCAFGHKITVRALIFLFLFFSTPTIGDASNYFYTNKLGLSSKVLSTVAVFGNVAGVVGIIVYQKLLRGVSMWSMILWGSIICCILGCIGVLLYSGTNEKMGIPDDIFLITDSTATVAISQAAVMPLFSLAALLCPEKVEGTIFALFTATMNFGTLAGVQIGALMTLLFGVDSHNFRLMWVLALVVSLLQLYPLFFLWLLPKGNTTDLDVSDTSAAYEDVIGKENKKD